MKEKIYEILNSIDVESGDEIIEKLEMRAGNIPDRTLTRMKTAIEFFNLKPQKIVNIVGTNGKGTVSNAIFQTLKSVSYTHLTLPTICSV